MDIKSMFSISQFISQDDLNLKYGITINTLNYMSLKKSSESNLTKTDGKKLSVSEKPMDVHWAYTLTDLFLNLWGSAPLTLLAKDSKDKYYAQ